jgi:hypothetical protein
MNMEKDAVRLEFVDCIVDYGHVSENYDTYCYDEGGKYFSFSF